MEADIIGVQYDTRVRVNGRCPLVIQCQAVNPDGKVYVFESDGIWFDPNPFWASAPPCRYWWTPTTTTGIR